MHKKILISGPFLSASGYGKMARFALDAICGRTDLFDVYVENISWGRTGNIFQETDIITLVDSLRDKTALYESNGGKYDVSLQITIPNEWKRRAAVNIGFTAGIEADVVSHVWYEPCRLMDKIITTSEFTKKVMVETIFAGPNDLRAKIQTPVESISFPYENKQKVGDSFNFKSDFNFLTVNQWGIRKNMETLISSFIDEFRDENVGLVIKANTISDSYIDKVATEKRLADVVNSKGNKKCQIYLIHGRMSDQDMADLYRNEKIKAFVTSTHGEGFGFPIFEATEAELPVVATDWSSHLEFLTIKEDSKPKKLFAKVDFMLDKIPPQAVWQGVLESHARWAYPAPNALRSRMREVYKDYNRFKSWAKKLAAYNKKKYQKQDLCNKFIDIIENNSTMTNILDALNE
jgi:glycosyltransferase involved in cell wall biosynthesis